MPDTPEGFDPDRPVTVNFEFRFLADTEKDMLDYAQVLESAITFGVAECLKLFKGRIVLLPTTEVVDRDEV
jgi:hypothetical protein